MLFKSLVFLAPAVFGLVEVAAAGGGGVLVGKRDLSTAYGLDKALNKKAFGDAAADAALGLEKRAVEVSAVAEEDVVARAIAPKESGAELERRGHDYSEETYEDYFHPHHQGKGESKWDGWPGHRSYPYDGSGHDHAYEGWHGEDYEYPEDGQWGYLPDDYVPHHSRAYDWGYFDGWHDHERLWSHGPEYKKKHHNKHHDKKDDKKGGWHEEPKAYVKKAKRADAPAGPRRQPAEQ